jgi:hypothetical protein
MAKSKAELVKEAQAAGVLAADVNPDDFSAADLEAMLNPEGAPAWKGSLSADKPIVAADGHVVLSKEDIANRA